MKPSAIFSEKKSPIDQTDQRNTPAPSFFEFPFLARRCLVYSSFALAVLTLPVAIQAQYNNTAYGAYALSRVTTGNLNSAFGIDALASNTTGTGNTASGALSLVANDAGDYNTGSGYDSLVYNTTGGENTASGAFSLHFNTTGSQNTACGTSALQGLNNAIANFNTATGYRALYSVYDGSGNVADGWQALYSNVSGTFNAAVGVSALRNNTGGNNNTGIGTNALYNTTGSNNVAVGFKAGESLTTGGNNIVIGAGVLGKAGEANTTRVGKTTQAAAYIGGIYSKTVASASGVAVRIDSTGKLGTVLSSARYKDNIKPMKDASAALLKLDPVTFNYKKELDPDGVTEFGLIAEQVEKINPDWSSKMKRVNRVPCVTKPSTQCCSTSS